MSAVNYKDQQVSEAKVGVPGSNPGGGAQPDLVNVPADLRQRNGRHGDAFPTIHVHSGPDTAVCGQCVDTDGRMTPSAPVLAAPAVGPRVPDRLGRVVDLQVHLDRMPCPLCNGCRWDSAIEPGRHGGMP